MALSMDEQRILAEIERHLAKAEPALAARLSSFGRPRAARALRSARTRVLASVATLIMVATVTAMLYALVALRASPERGLGGRPTAAPAVPAIGSPGAGSPGAGSPTTAGSSAIGSASTGSASTGSSTMGSSGTGSPAVKTRAGQHASGGGYRKTSVATPFR